MPNQYYPMSAMPQQQLETMYPKTYQIIQPVVENTCNNMNSAYGQVHTPNKAQLEAMIDDVYEKVEADVDAAVRQSTGEERQFFGGGRRILRDFIGALLITSLIRRRPYYYNYPGFFGYPGYFGGGSGFYGGYPYYY